VEEPEVSGPSAEDPEKLRMRSSNASNSEFIAKQRSSRAFWLHLKQLTEPQV
jgi:hypothetical protein